MYRKYKGKKKKKEEEPREKKPGAPYTYAKKGVLITPRVFEEMLYASDQQWVRALLVYLYLYGVRITEALRLTWDDFTIEEIDGVEYLIANSPTVKNRTVLSRRIYTRLDTNYIDVLVNYWHIFGRGGLTRYRGALVWPYSRGWAWRKVHELNEEISPHIFRHNRLTRFAQGGATAFQIRDFAGHTDLRASTAYIQISGVSSLRMAQNIKVT